MDAPATSPRLPTLPQVDQSLIINDYMEKNKDTLILDLDMHTLLTILLEPTAEKSAWALSIFHVLSFKNRQSCN